MFVPVFVLNNQLPAPFSNLPKDITKLIITDLDVQDAGRLRSVCRDFHHYADLQPEENLRRSYVFIDAGFIPDIKILEPLSIEAIMQDHDNSYIERCVDGKKVRVPMKELLIQQAMYESANGIYEQKNAKVRETALQIVIELGAFKSEVQMAFMHHHKIDDVSYYTMSIRKIIEQDLRKQLSDKVKDFRNTRHSPPAVEQAKSIFRIKLAILNQESLRIELYHASHTVVRSLKIFKKRLGSCK
jgi:hypothetical protein